MSDEPRQGAPGTPGQPGQPGQTGQPGQPGVPGVPGQPGQPGQTGQAGVAGEVGETGEIGETGATGEAGTPGLDLSVEFRAMRQDVGRLANALVTLGSDDRLEKAVESVAEEEKRHRQRLGAILLAPLLLAIAVGAGSWWQARSNGEAFENTRVVADYVRDCLQHPENLTPEQLAERCGRTADGSASALAALVEFQTCALLAFPDWTEENLSACTTRALESVKEE